MPLHAGLSADVTVDTRHRRTSVRLTAANQPAQPYELRAALGGHGVPLHRGMITVTVMVASILQALDNTIANVALPRMQGSLSATQDQMTWVLTSYIVAAAIMTPLTGWLADRFGRKPLFLVSIIGFTLASALCGMAQSLEQIVLFRVLQGLFGAALIPMSQAVLFDVYPPEQHGRAMAIWGMGVVLGPTLGPMLGGWLTDNYSWRWVFYINVPFGILAVLACWPTSPTPRTSARASISSALRCSALPSARCRCCSIAARSRTGSIPARSSSRRRSPRWRSICSWCTRSRPRRPFIRLALYKDRNFLTGNILIFVVGIVLFATLALLPPLLQGLMGYSVFQAGTGDRAARRRHAAGHVVHRPPGRAHRRAPDHRRRPGAHGVLAVADDALFDAAEHGIGDLVRARSRAWAPALSTCRWRR